MKETSIAQTIQNKAMLRKKPNPTADKNSPQVWFQSI